MRERLAKHLDGGEAYMTLAEMLKKIPYEEINIRPHNLPYSIYEMFYHIAFTQKDIVKFTCSNDYTEPKWPDYYWPKEKTCQTKKEWENLQADFFTDRERMKNYITESEYPLMKPVKNGKDPQTLLRETLLLIEHTSYHTGQLLILLRLLNLH